MFNMNIEDIIMHMQQEKIGRDQIDSNYLSSDDYNICNYIIDYIPIINFPSYKGKRISKRYLFKESLKQFNLLDGDNYQRLLDIIDNVKIIKDYPLYTAGVSTCFNVSFEANEKRIMIPGYTTTFHIPKKLYDVDIINLGHEYCHMLKETNLLEHKNALVLGEVIPM